MTEEGSCSRMLYLALHRFICLQSPTASLVPWDSSALSGWHGVGILSVPSTARGRRREVTLLHGRLELPALSTGDRGIRWESHKTGWCWDTHTQDNVGAGPRPVQPQMSHFQRPQPIHGQLETNP